MFCDGISLSLIGFVITFVSRSNGIRTQTVWQIKQPLHGYERYSSFYLSSFTIPTLALRSTWLFTAYVDDTRCKVDNAFIGLQYGGFPAFAPLNESFPPFFHTHRSHFTTLFLKTDNSSLNYTIENPIPGKWYTASALQYDTKKHIKQKGLSVECHIYLDIIHQIVSKEDVLVLTAGVEKSLVVEHGQNVLARFVTGKNTYKYTVTISNCSLTTCDNTSCSTFGRCSIRLSTRSQAFPSLADNHTNTISCSVSKDPSSSCFLLLEQPAVSDWQYVMIECLQQGSMRLNILILQEDCEWIDMGLLKLLTPFAGSLSYTSVTEDLESEKQTNGAFSETKDSFVLMLDEENARISKLSLDKFEYNEPSEKATRASLDAQITTNPVCLRLSDFGRFYEFKQTFAVIFQRRIGDFPIANVLNITEGKIVIAAFSIEPLFDTGATLKLNTNFLVEFLNGTTQIVVIELCLSKFRIPFSNGKLSCPSETPLLEVSNEPGKNSSAKVYIPYPEAGVWFLALAVKCFSINSRISEPCHVQDIMVINKITLLPCVDDSCGTDGSCREYTSGIMHFSSCYCYYGYRGYGCTDATYAVSSAEQLVAILLLTLSNLFFLPAVIVCLKRRFFTEALVYFFTMFFSSFYHACDGESRYTVCIMPYNVLSYCDFLLAIVSFWVTLVTMAKLPLQFTSFSYVLALLALAMGVQWDKQSLWTFLVPSVVAGIILIVSWALQCHQRHSIYPSRRRWLLFILPGIFLALLGLIIFAVFETKDNYQYTHSAWHMCIALCIVFLLPPRFDLGVSDNDVLCGIVVSSPSDIALVDYAASPADVLTPPKSDDGLLQPLPENIESGTAVANTGTIHPSEESVNVSKNNIQDLMKNGFV